jgi:NADH dehydrogenase [ubiquinone] 1 alpha subcomplex assembly factor 5
MWELMEDLRDMGETNAIIGRLFSMFHHLVDLGILLFVPRRHFIHRDTLAAASAIYKGSLLFK